MKTINMVIYATSSMKEDEDEKDERPVVPILECPDCIRLAWADVDWKGIDKQATDML